MGTEFVLMTALKLCTIGGVGIAITTAFQFFHNYEYKSSKKKGDEQSGTATKTGEVLREKSRLLG